MSMAAYVKVEGQTQGHIKGSVTQKGREDLIMVLATTHSVVSPRDMATGLSTGKRQHKPIRSRAYVDQSAGGTAQFNPKEISVDKTVPWQSVRQPLDRGAVRVKVKYPWAGCRVGARYAALMLGGGAQRYELQDAIVTSCASDSISFDYASYRGSPIRQSPK